MNTINYEALRNIYNTLRAECAEVDEAYDWAEAEATIADRDLATAEADVTTDPEAMDALYEANDRAVLAARQARERLSDIQAVYHAFGQAIEMLNDYKEAYIKDGE